jgi:hypothetical protein
MDRSPPRRPPASYSYEFQSTKLSGLRFRALLTEGVAERFELLEVEFSEIRIAPVQHRECPGL